MSGGDVSKESAVAEVLADATAKPPDPEVAARIASEISAEAQGWGPGPGIPAGFDPAIHRVNADGSPKLTKKGKPWPKPGVRTTGKRAGRIRSKAVDPEDQVPRLEEMADPLAALDTCLSDEEIEDSAKGWTEITERVGCIAAGGDVGKMDEDRKGTFVRAFSRMVERHPAARCPWWAQLSACVGEYAKECAERAQQQTLLGRGLAWIRARMPGGAA